MAQSHDFLKKIKAEGQRAYEQAVLSEAVDAAQMDVKSYEIDFEPMKGQPPVLILNYEDGSSVELEMTGAKVRPMKATSRNRRPAAVPA